MPRNEEVYVCKKCGYVLPKRDAVVSGWDAEGSTTHVHCPRCGKIIARYVEQEGRHTLEFDRIDKGLFILPFLSLADTLSTEFSLIFGGMEGGPIAGPVYEQYGQSGLVALTIFSFFISFGCVWFLRYGKRRIRQGEGSKLNRIAMVYAILFFFFLEACIVGVVVHLVYSKRNETDHKKTIVTPISHKIARMKIAHLQAGFLIANLRE